MRKLYVVRHADAGHRGGQHEPDEQRSLSERGERQADGLGKQLADAGITRLLASPSLRCQQTLAPLGGRLELAVEVDDRLNEGQGAAGALAVAEEMRDTNAVLCSHGDVIPDLLDALVAGGTRLKGELRWQKASTWVLSWDGDHLVKGRYLPPPS
ncbi:MAG: phosphoglycerate mutase family protein [Acidimicrobiales bacterium]